MSEGALEKSAPKVFQPSEFPTHIRLLRWMGRQNWMPRGQDRLLRMMWKPGSRKHFRFEIDFFGKRYRGDLAELLDWMVFTYGAAPLSELSLLEEITKELRRTFQTITFFDIGANRGHHTLFMSGVADRIYAFEPFPEVRASIEEKVAMNKLQNVQIVPVALGDEDRELLYHPSIDGNSGAGTFVERPGDIYGAPVALTIRAGDRLFDELQAPRLDILKVDVEGFEPMVFRGLAEHIRRDRPAIMTEWSDSSRKGVGNEKEFRELFYEDAVIAEVGGRMGRRFKLRPFSYPDALEVLVLPSERASFIRDRL